MFSLPYLVPRALRLSHKILLELDEAARERLGLTEEAEMCTFEILTQADLGGHLDDAGDDWEVNALEWPLRHLSKERAAAGTEFLFTQVDLLNWIEKAIRAQVTQDQEAKTKSKEKEENS